MTLNKCFKFAINALALITSVVWLNGCNTIHDKTAKTANTTDNTVIEIPVETEMLKPSSVIEETAETTKPTADSSEEYTSLEDTKPTLDDTIIGMDGALIDVPSEQKGEYGAAFDTFTFYRDSTGLIFNDDEYRDCKSEWKKAVPGDIFGSLVVSSVSAVYDPVCGEHTEDHSLGEYYAWFDREMSLSGSVVLKGIMYADAREGSFWAKSLFFRPTAKSLADNKFPTLISISRCFSTYMYSGESHEDSQVFCLGRTDDFKDIIDWSEYTDEDNMIKVYAEVELSNIELSYNTCTGSSNIGKATMTKIIRICNDDSFIREDVLTAENEIATSEDVCF